MHISWRGTWPRTSIYDGMPWPTSSSEGFLGRHSYPREHVGHPERALGEGSSPGMEVRVRGRWIPMCTERREWNRMFYETATIKTAMFKETLRLSIISMNRNFANYEKSMYLGVGTVLTSSPSYTASVVLPASSQSLAGSTQVPSNSADLLTSGHCESFWSLLFGALDETFPFTAFLPSALGSLKPLDSRVTSTYSKTTNSEAILTKPPFSTTGFSSIKSPSENVALALFPKNHPSSSRRHDFSWSSSLSIRQSLWE